MIAVLLYFNLYWCRWPCQCMVMCWAS